MAVDSLIFNFTRDFLSSPRWSLMKGLILFTMHCKHLALGSKRLQLCSMDKHICSSRDLSKLKPVGRCKPAIYCSKTYRRMWHKRKQHIQTENSTIYDWCLCANKSSLIFPDYMYFGLFGDLIPQITKKTDKNTRTFSNFLT